MEIIALFFPTTISMKISVNRSVEKDTGILQVIIKYGLYVLADNLLTQLIITYVLGISDVTADAFNSFPFFTKYVVIAAFVAMLLPFCVELVKKYFSITVETGVDGEKGRNNKKSN